MNDLTLIIGGDIDEKIDMIVYRIQVARLRFTRAKTSEKRTLYQHQLRTFAQELVTLLEPTPITASSSGVPHVSGVDTRRS